LVRSGISGARTSIGHICR